MSGRSAACLGPPTTFNIFNNSGESAFRSKANQVGPTGRVLSRFCHGVGSGDTFDGALIIVALPTQEYRLVGVISALVWRYAWQLAVTRCRPCGQRGRPR
jgi:hypothetical protein